jgi:uncharacterized delta-60 repeat protein
MTLGYCLRRNDEEVNNFSTNQPLHLDWMLKIVKVGLRRKAPVSPFSEGFQIKAIAARSTHGYTQLPIHQPHQMNRFTPLKFDGASVRQLVMAICAAFGCLLCGAVSAVPGHLDRSFASGGLSVVPISNYPSPALNADYGGAAATRPDGKIVIAGNCPRTANSTIFDLCVVRLSSDGFVDPTFGVAGVVRNAICTASTACFGLNSAKLLLQSDGKILVAGSCQDGDWFVCVVRLGPDGALDTSFNATGIVGPFVVRLRAVSGIHETVDHKLLFTGHCFDPTARQNLCAVRMTPTGGIDVAYGNAGRSVTAISTADSATSSFVQADGKLLLAGYCGGNAGDPSAKLCASRLKSDGQTDSSFGNAGAALIDIPGVSIVSAVVFQRGDGSITLAGQCVNQSTALTALCFVRLGADGVVDQISAPVGSLPRMVSYAIAVPHGPTIARDGDRILLSWNCDSAGGPLCAARFLESGQVDTSFGVGGGVTHQAGVGNFYVNHVTSAQQGKTLLTGSCENWEVVIPNLYSINHGLVFCVARLKGGPYDPLTCALNVDANQAIGLTTDGVLIVRYLLGLSGASLTTGALGQNPTRTGQALEDHLASLNLDADGDGQASAMTDGLLMLRAMLGLTGNALTAGATNAAHPNVRNAQQILTWIEQTHGVACLP